MAFKPVSLILLLLNLSLNCVNGEIINSDKPWQSGGRYYIGDIETSEENYLIELEKQDNALDEKIKEEVDKALSEASQAFIVPLKRAATIIMGAIFIKYFIKSITINPSDSLLDRFAQQRIKKFKTGLAIGVAHGAANKWCRSLYNKKGGLLLSMHTLWTYIGANKLEYICNWNDHDYASDSLWGRAIGQCFTESIDIKHDQNQNHMVNFDFALNWSLIKAFFQ